MMDALKVLLEPATEPTELYKLGTALWSEKRPLPGGADPNLIAEVLLLHMQDEDLKSPAYMHAMSKPTPTGSVRSFAPCDLQPEQAAPLRAVAAASQNAFVRLRIFDVLFMRFKVHDDARHGFEAAMDGLPLCNAQDHWRDGVRTVWRALALAKSLNDADAFVRAWGVVDRFFDDMCSGSHAFGLGRLLATVAPFIDSSRKAAFTQERADRWSYAMTLSLAKYQHDVHCAENLAIPLAPWTVKWGQLSDPKLIYTWLVNSLREVAKASEEEFYFRKALTIAQDRGLTALTNEIRLEHSNAVRAASSKMAVIATGEFPPIDPDEIALLQTIAKESPNATSALVQLSSLRDLLQLDMDAIHLSASETLRSNPFRLFIDSVTFSDGKITHEGNDIETRIRQESAFYAQLVIRMIEHRVDYFLSFLHDRFDPNTLLNGILPWPHLKAERLAVLAAASERFARRDFVSAGALIATIYEALLRDLMRARGYAALKPIKVQPTLQQDETLSSLLSAEPVRELLGPRHVALVNYVLCNPQLGFNMRNRVAHGLATASDFTPSRVLLVWLFVFRLSAYWFPGSDQVEPESKEQEGPPEPPDASGADEP